MNSFVVWTGIAVLVAAAAALLLGRVRGRKGKEEADPEDNYPLW
ncbi:MULTISPECIES: hypothetical protein [unclassified Mesorhizobium]|jgi:hypothetical protein|nr:MULTISPECIES: hypothetical protein [unclassified Mesorhizobium]